jgi:hypothetical protein
MRIVVPGVIFALTVMGAAAVPLSGAAAQSYIYYTPWCVRAYDGATDCSYFTLLQCRQAVSATGGDCAVNPRFVGEPPRRPGKARRNAR